MNKEQLEIELDKMRIQQQQWHDDFQLKLNDYDQIEAHWKIQRWFWVGTVILIGLGIIFK